MPGAGVKVRIELTEEYARELATICKRMTFVEARTLGGDTEEAYRFIEATNDLRRRLELNGVYPR